jgi:hypothetical protein
MKLSVLDRLVLLSLSLEGSLTTIKILHDLKMAVSFSEAENKKLLFKTTADGGMEWKDGTPDKEIPIGEQAAKIIKEAISVRDKQGKLTENFLPLIEKVGYTEEKVA